MLRFLKENWIWIVLPFVLVVGGIILFAVLGSGENPASEFIYSI